MSQDITQMNKEVLDQFSLAILENTGTYREYSDEDLSNAIIILNEVFMAKMFDYQGKRLSHPKMEIAAAQAGFELKRFIEKYTGVDLHKIYK